MSALSRIGVTVGYVCIAVSILSVLLPQKRTRRVMGFVIGVFLIGSVLGAVVSEVQSMELSLPDPETAAVQRHDESEYTDAAVQLTADHLTLSAKELLENEGITPEDIRLTLKISDEGRISVVRAVIYISGADEKRREDIERIIYRNLLKEPEIYVAEQAAQ